MKIIIFLLAFVTYIEVANSQDCKYKYYNMRDSLCFQIESEVNGENSFSINYRSSNIYNNSSHPIGIIGFSEYLRYEFSKGKCKISNDTIKCYDYRFKRYYIFKKIDSFTILSLKNTALFSKGDTLKLFYMYNKNENYVIGANWKGKYRDGMWVKHNIKSELDSISYYDNDVLLRKEEKETYKSNIRVYIYNRPY